MSRKSLFASLFIILGIFLLLLLPKLAQNVGPLGGLEVFHFLSGAYSQVKYQSASGFVFYWRSEYLYLSYLLVFTLTFSFPLIFSLYKGEAFAKQQGSNAKLLWRMPLYTLAPTIGVMIVQLAWIAFALQHPWASGEQSVMMFLVFLPMMLPFYVGIYVLLSFFLATILYARSHSLLLMGTICGLVAILFFIGPLLHYVLVHGPGYPR